MPMKMLSTKEPEVEGLINLKLGGLRGEHEVFAALQKGGHHISSKVVQTILCEFKEPTKEESVHLVVATPAALDFAGIATLGEVHEHRHRFGLTSCTFESVIELRLQHRQMKGEVLFAVTKTKKELHVFRIERERKGRTLMTQLDHNQVRFFENHDRLVFALQPL